MNKNDWSEYLRKQRIQDLRALAKKLGIHIKSKTRKNDCIDIILDTTPEIILNSMSLGASSEGIFSRLNDPASLPKSSSEQDYSETNEVYDHTYFRNKVNNSSTCSMCHRAIFNNSVKCDACLRKFHYLCVGYDKEVEVNKNQLMVFIEDISKRERTNVDVSSLKFICPFCRFIALDPYNDNMRPLFFTTVYSYTAIHNIHPKHGSLNFSNSGHLPQFTSKFTFSPKTVFCEGSSKDVPNKDGLIIYCLRLDKMDLNNEFPRLLLIKANNKIVQTIESPSYDHIRRDCPIDLKNFIILNNLVSKANVTLTFNTLNALIQENSIEKQCLSIPTAPFIIGLFYTRSLSSQEIIDSLISERSLSFNLSKIHFRNIFENKLSYKDTTGGTIYEDSADDIVCLNKDQSLNILCPLTMDKIELPARGCFCKHINCFDLRAFVQINTTIKAFNTRWKCPYCYQIIRPSMLIIDNFVKSLISDNEIQKDNKIIINSTILDREELSDSKLNDKVASSQSVYDKDVQDLREIGSNEASNSTDNQYRAVIKLEGTNPHSTNCDQPEIIDISDDDEETISDSLNITSNEGCVNSGNNDIIEDPYSEYILKSLSIQGSSEIEKALSESSKKRKVFYEPSSHKSPDGKITSSNYDKASLSLRL